MSDISTWHERAMRHPDHQSGMISEDMIRARMGEEIADLRTEVERLTRQRDEARAEIERQARHIEGLREKIDAEGSCACSLDAPGDICAAHSPALMRARAEVERLRADHGALRSAAREYLETLGGALKSGKFEMGGTAEMAHFVRQAMQKLDSLVFDRAGPRPAGLEKLHEPHGRAS